MDAGSSAHRVGSHPRHPNGSELGTSPFSLSALFSAVAEWASFRRSIWYRIFTPRHPQDVWQVRGLCCQMPADR
jgi:hypothetical protein